MGPSQMLIPVNIWDPLAEVHCGIDERPAYAKIPGELYKRAVTVWAPAFVMRQMCLHHTSYLPVILSCALLSLPSNEDPALFEDYLRRLRRASYVASLSADMGFSLFE